MAGFEAPRDSERSHCRREVIQQRARHPPRLFSFVAAVDRGEHRVARLVPWAPRLESPLGVTDALRLRLRRRLRACGTPALRLTELVLIGSCVCVPQPDY